MKWSILYQLRSDNFQLTEGESVQRFEKMCELLDRKGISYEAEWYD